MATEKIKFKTPDEYIQSFPKEIQAILKKIRTTLQKAVPESEEVISYNIPAFKYHGWIFYYSVYTRHFSLSCPPPWTIFEVFKKELQPYQMSKSTIQFPLDEPVPVKLIEAMARFRAKETLNWKKRKRKNKAIAKAVSRVDAYEDCKRPSFYHTPLIHQIETSKEVWANTPVK